MKRILFFLFIIVLIATGCSLQKERSFVSISGTYLLDPKGDTLPIIGINLGNWLNPEGYMFGFRRCNSAGRIDEAFCELIGPDETDRFWTEWKDAYITEDDIRYIAHTGATTIRLPFHYKLFTRDRYLGNQSDSEGFARIDSTISWCRRYGLYLILDMHDAPGGQTGDNIDDSYGYPWLMLSEGSQQEFCAIWRRIAERYKDEPVILGYELINEPIAHYFKDDLDSLNAQLEPLYKRAVAAIREVDRNHIILLGGAQWNGTFAGVFHDWTFDDKLMYTCHRYHHPATIEGIRDFVVWRDSTGLPMYMGETGHESIEWTEDECELLIENNIGYTFWPYKKMGKSSWLGFAAPSGWDEVVAFAEADRSTYRDIREKRPAYEVVYQALFALLDSCRFEHCSIDSAYIEAMQLRP